MKKIVFLITALILSTLLFSCETETSGNGKLDGLWQLTQEDSLGISGESTTTKDMRESGIYWGMQGDLLRIGGIYFDFEHNGNTLRLWNPFREDTYLEDASELHRYGLSHLDETLTIEQLTGSQLILRTEIVRLHLRKY